MFVIPNNTPIGMARGYAATIPGARSLSEMAVLISRNAALTKARAAKRKAPKTMADRRAELDAMKAWLRTRGH